MYVERPATATTKRYTARYLVGPPWHRLAYYLRARRLGWRIRWGKP